MLCHLFFELIVPSGGCFATSFGLGGCFSVVVLLHLLADALPLGSYCCNGDCATLVLLCLFFQVQL